MGIKVVEHLNKITEATNEVKTTIETETYGMDPRDTLAMPMLLLPLKMELKVWALDSGTEEYDDVIKELGILRLDFSKLPFAEIYSIHHVNATKLCIKENALAYQATKNTRKEKGCKVLINVKDQEIKAHEQSQLTLE